MRVDFYGNLSVYAAAAEGYDLGECRSYIEAPIGDLHILAGISHELVDHLRGLLRTVVGAGQEGL